MHLSVLACGGGGGACAAAAALVSLASVRCLTDWVPRLASSPINLDDFCSSCSHGGVSRNLRCLGGVTGFYLLSTCCFLVGSTVRATVLTRCKASFYCKTDWEEKLFDWLALSSCDEVEAVVVSLCSL